MFIDKFLQADCGEFLKVSESIDKILQKYNEGFQTGFTWPEKLKYKPCGPLVFTCKDTHWHTNKCQWCDKTAQSLAEHNNWLKGWEDGYAKQLKEKE